MLLRFRVINLLLILTVINAEKCIRRKFSGSSFVCVCNSTYCDTIDPLPTVWNPNKYVMYTSTQKRQRLEQSTGQFTGNNAGEYHSIVIQRNRKYQKIMGFGGAMTDSTGLNIASLSQAAQDLLMQQYFGDKGLLYTIIRVPIGGTDFSTHPYTLDDTPYDIDLVNFKLQREDYKYKIPYLKQARNLSTTYPIKLMGCAWSSPAYMKTNNALIGGARLYDEYFPTFANYLIKFLKAYKDEGFDYYILSTQNEAAIASIPGYGINGLGFDAHSQGRFVANDLGPTMEENGFGHVKIMIGDDQRPLMLDWVKQCLENKKARKYVAGVGIHFYFDSPDTAEQLTEIHELPEFQNKFILYSEACQGSAGKYRGTRLGSWDFGQGYLSNIIDDLNHWAEGWTDWNMVLNTEGGPTWARNFVDAPIIVNASSQEFYKNPMYYALAHVSKFLVPGSTRIDLVNNDNIAKATAFETPNNNTVIVLLNTHKSAQYVPIRDADRNLLLRITMKPASMVTIVYPSNNL